jgi:hypothetical protein
MNDDELYRAELREIAALLLELHAALAAILRGERP